MTVLVAVTDTPEGAHALTVGKEEAERLRTELLVLNLSLTEFAPTEIAVASGVDVLDRAGREARDPAVAVLDLIQERPDIERLVVLTGQGKKGTVDRTSLLAQVLVRPARWRR
ncbi:universal stress protein [Rhodococcus sp. SC4]|nr:universal stress protein [Rhodococcus sp. SC4]